MPLLIIDGEEIANITEEHAETLKRLARDGAGYGDVSEPQPMTTAEFQSLVREPRTGRPQESGQWVSMQVTFPKP